MSLIIYASETELDQILSPFGVEVRTDDADDGSTDESIIAAVLEQATVEVNNVLLQRYPLTAIAPGNTAITAVKWATAYIACFLLCERRANPAPAPIQARYEKIMEWLEKIEAGSIQLVGDGGIINPQFDDTPAVSNFKYNEFYRRTQVRRDPATSTGGPQTPGRKQHNDWFYGWGWGPW